jgi:hypothetical protein
MKPPAEPGTQRSGRVMELVRIRIGNSFLFDGYLDYGTCQILIAELGKWINDIYLNEDKSKDEP